MIHGLHYRLPATDYRLLLLKGNIMKRSFWTLGLLIVLVSAVAPGCVGRALKEGAGVIIGARGTFVPIQPVAVGDGRPLGIYKRFELETKDDFGGKTPPELWDRLPQALADVLAKKKIPNEPSGKTLLVRVRTLHYEDASLVGMALGPLEEVVTRVELVDKSSGKVLGVANCIGRTKETVNQGVAKKAAGLAKGIGAWIDKRYPKAGRED